MGIVLHSLQLVCLRNALEIDSQFWHIALCEAMREMCLRSVLLCIISNLSWSGFPFQVGWTSCLVVLASLCEAREKIVVVAQCTKAPTISDREQEGKRVQLQ